VRPAAGTAGRLTRRKERRKHERLACRTVCVCGALFRLAARFAGGRTLSLFRALRVFRVLRVFVVKDSSLRALRLNLGTNAA